MEYRQYCFIFKAVDGIFSGFTKMPSIDVLALRRLQIAMPVSQLSPLPRTYGASYYGDMTFISFDFAFDALFLYF